MLGQVRDRVRAVRARVRRFERREVRAFRRWIEHTSNLIHLSVLILLPVVLGVVTALSNAVDLLPFLLFPPLASGGYTLFANPESRYASPRRFVGGLTAGALCGWLALEVTARYYQVPTETFQVNAGAVALGIFLTGAVTWALDMEEAAAFSTALLVHVTGTAQFAYVLSVAASSLLVAGAFVLWRDNVYEQRAEFLYESTKGDDHVLVPMRGRRDDATAMLGARLAAAHDAGKVVLLDVVEDEDVATEKQAMVADEGHLATDSAADRAPPTVEVPEADPEGVHPADVNQQWAEFLQTPADHGPGNVDAGDVSQDWAAYDEDDLLELAQERAVAESATTLEAQADRIETVVDVPCEVVVAVGRGPLARTVTKTAHEANCDLIAVPYETDDGRLAPYIRNLFRGDVDVLVHRSYDGRTRWQSAMVPVRRAGDVAHSMIDFAKRLVGRAGSVSVCRCIDTENDRRRAEEMLANLVETVDGPVETRIPHTRIETFLDDHADEYDLVIVGSSQDRSKASRFISPPTFERLSDVETDVAIVDRNY